MRNLKQIFLAALALVFLALSLRGAAYLIDGINIITAYRSTQGKITILPESGYKAAAYSDKDGKNHIVPVSGNFAFLLVDKSDAPVFYDPRDPEKIYAGQPMLLFIPVIGFLAVGGFGLYLTSRSLKFRELQNAIRAFAGKAPLAEDKAAAQQPEQSKMSDNPTVIPAAKAAAVNLDEDILKNLFGPLIPLINNTAISDIIISGPSAVYIKDEGRTQLTQVKFESDYAYERFIDHMLTVAGNPYSLSKLIVDGMITPLIRMHAVHSSLCEDGPYVTLRISRFKSVKYQDLANGTMAPREIFAYLRAVLLTGNTILVAGEVGTGKTTLLRALGSTVPKEENILVIEDIPEIKIDHPAVRYVRTREANIEGSGKVAPAECIRAGMRMAMNRIIFGEIRDAEAAESFIDVCVSGHPGMSTIHARSARDAVERLELFLARRQPGVERTALMEQIAAAVQVIAFTKVCPQTKHRRISEVVEIQRAETGSIDSQSLFEYSVSGGLPVWKFASKKSFFETSLRTFEGGSPLIGLSEWLTVQQTKS